MKRILIADDERRARSLLRAALTSHLDAQRFNIVAEAGDGIEALELFRQYMPDIVLMDVDMPFKDGLTALKEMHALKRNVKVIIITGHNRFDYAHRALNLGADFLLLKPIVEKELADMVVQLANALDDELIQKAKWDHMNSVINENMALLRRNFIKTIVTTDTDQALSFNHTAQMYGIDVNAETYFVACVQIRSSETLHPGETSLELLGIENIIKSMSTDRNIRSYSYINAQNRIVVLFCCNSLQEMEKEQLMAEMQNMSDAFAESEISWGVGSIVQDIHHVKSSYYGALRALQYKHQFEGNSITDYRDVGLRPRESGYYFGSDIESILTMFRTSEISRAERRVRDIYKQINEDHATAYAKNFALEIVVALRRGFTELGLDADSLANWEDKILKSHVSVHDYCNMTVEMIWSLNEQKSKSVEQRLSRKIVMAQEYIRENYSDPSFGLQAVSNYVDLSATYFSSLFFSQVGVHFNEYLTVVRIEKAKELLSEGISKIYEIAQKTGFHDPKYFSSKFKRIVGISPSDYRESFIKNSNEQI